MSELKITHHKVIATYGVQQRMNTVTIVIVILRVRPLALSMLLMSDLRRVKRPPVELLTLVFVVPLTDFPISEIRIIN